MASLTSVSKSNHGKIKWHGQHSIKQPFNLPDSIIYYLTKNPSNQKCYSKMIQSCKYFFETNSIIIAKNIYGDKLCYEKHCTVNCTCNRNVTVNFSKCLSKIWLLNGLVIPGKSAPNAGSLLCSKLYRIEIKVIIAYDINLKFDDFKMLTSTAIDVHLLKKVKIIYEGEKTAMLEQILQAIPNIETFQCNFTNDIPVISGSTMKNIRQLKNFTNLRQILLLNITEIFNLDDFSIFINDNKKLWFKLIFRDGVSEAYKSRLDAIVDALIESKLAGRFIFYNGMNEDKRQILGHRYYNTFK